MICCVGSSLSSIASVCFRFSSFTWREILIVTRSLVEVVFSSQRCVLPVFKSHVILDGHFFQSRSAVLSVGIDLCCRIFSPQMSYSRRASLRYVSAI